MKQIYNFEQQTPPILRETMLREKLNRRRQDWQTALASASAILLQIVIALLGHSAIGWYPWLAAGCFCYLLVTVTGSGVIAIVYSRKGGSSI